MFSAKYDRIVRLEHNKIYAEKLKHVVVKHYELEGDHFSFLIPKDIEWYNQIYSLLE